MPKYPTVKSPAIKSPAVRTCNHCGWCVCGYGKMECHNPKSPEFETWVDIATSCKYFSQDTEELNETNRQ